MRTLFIGMLFIFLVSLQFRLWKPGGLFHEYQHHLQGIAEQRRENMLLIERNRYLAAELQLQKDNLLSAVEARARQRLGMIRSDETFIWVVKED